jgi:ActR/RegA family two-component response regulator
MTDPVRVLLVDDNKPYRQAFRRNLALQGFAVAEAENADEAVAALRDDPPDVVVTDLQMRTRTEGLDLIRAARNLSPLMPIIMISAVGTFEEGAEASRLGAMHVIAKSKIEEEIERLYNMIRSAHRDRATNQALLDEMEKLRSLEQAGMALGRLREIQSMPEVGDFVKSEAYEAIIALSGHEMLANSIASLRDAGDALKETDGDLEAQLPGYEKLSEESRESLRTAEFLFRQERQMDGNIDFSRNIGFSYCFAVENEAKSCLSRKINRMLQNSHLYQAIDQLLEGQGRRLGVFFHQALLQIQREHMMDFSIDNVRQVFARILEYREKYKPDGLKATAVLIVCFGRSYDVSTARSKVSIRNLLNLNGLDSESDVLMLAQRLARLQHFRNPYIHPEISEREAISAIRSEAIECLRAIQRIV